MLESIRNFLGYKSRPAPKRASASVRTTAPKKLKAPTTRRTPDASSARSPSAPNSFETLAPNHYFTSLKRADLKSQIEKLNSLSHVALVMDNSLGSSSQEVRLTFEREGIHYTATFTVKRESETLNTYELHAEVSRSNGRGSRKVFSKEKHHLDYAQIDHSIIFVFHQAFVPE